MTEHSTYELVPSGDKEKLEGWQNYLADRDKGVEHAPNTEQRLLYIHKVLTGHLDVGMPPAPIRAEQLYELVVTDRPDGEEIQDAIEQVYGNDWWNNEASLLAVSEAITNICKDNTRVKYEEDFRGKLRSFGTRSINGSTSEPVYWSHSCVYGENARETFEKRRFTTINNPAVYCGLSTGLDKVYAKMCATYDRLKEEAHDLDQLLFAEAFLQLVGTRIVHPIADGNGRVFATHLAHTLYEAGIRIDDHESFKRFFPGLTCITDTFITEHFLPDLGLDLISGLDNIRIKTDHRFRQNYMRTLRTGIESMIDENIQPNAQYLDFMANNRWQIKRVLLQLGLIKPTPGDKKRLKMEEEMFSEMPEKEKEGKIIFVPYQSEMERFSPRD
ncbi:hypothetical protein HYY69_02270 [Candidatus Woesearchaeota archaeon]|nr:hypothetical protein [Candidatus Woesearchaeota archaeon]